MQGAEQEQDILTRLVQIPVSTGGSSQGLEVLITPAKEGKNGPYLAFKRLFDVVFSLIFIAFIFSWLFPLVALLVKLHSKGPVLFTQRRTGMNGKIFNCIKFRTMLPNDFADTKQAMDDDKRITHLGRFLRNTNLDELPQFLNVMKGDMSIVGPRPHMVYHTLQFSGLIVNYPQRHAIKPGITGLAQVKGWRGPTPTFRSIYKRVQWDIYYVQHQSMKLDAYIFGQTLREVISNFTISIVRLFQGR